MQVEDNQVTRIGLVIRGELEASELTDEEVLELGLATMEGLVYFRYQRNPMTFTDHLTVQ